MSSKATQPDRKQHLIQPTKIYSSSRTTASKTTRSPSTGKATSWEKEDSLAAINSSQNKLKKSMQSKSYKNQVSSNKGQNKRYLKMYLVNERDSDP